MMMMSGLVHDDTHKWIMNSRPVIQGRLRGVRTIGSEAWLDRRLPVLAGVRICREARLLVIDLVELLRRTRSGVVVGWESSRPLTGASQEGSIKSHVISSDTHMCGHRRGGRRGLRPVVAKGS